MKGPQYSRRQALQAVGLMMGTIYATPQKATQYGRVMSLVLDDVSEIVVRYRGRQVSINPGAILDALTGREDTHVAS